jgi:hypothetical protein
MAFYLKHAIRETRTVHLVEGKDREDAAQHDGEYLGYVDGDDNDCEWFGPFETREEALESDYAWVQ